MKIEYKHEYTYQIPYTAEGIELANKLEEHARLLFGYETMLDRSSTVSQMLVLTDRGIAGTDDEME